MRLEITKQNISGYQQKDNEMKNYLGQIREQEIKTDKMSRFWKK